MKARGTRGWLALASVGLGWLGLALHAAHAAPAASASAEAAGPQARAEAFFQTVVQGDTAKAFDTLLAGSSIRANKPEAATRLKAQMETGLRVYGKPLGAELVEAKTFGGSLVRLVYLFRLEKYPLTWEFFFYRGSGETWLPIDVRFNDKLDVYRYDASLPAPGGTDKASSADGSDPGQ